MLQTRDLHYARTGLDTMRKSWAVFSIQAPSKNSHKGWSAVNKVVTRGKTVSIHKCTYGVGFKRHAPWALQEIGKFAAKERGTTDVCINTRFNRAAWAKGTRNAQHRSVCSCPENVVKTHRTSSTCCPPTCLSPLSKIYGYFG